MTQVKGLVDAFDAFIVGCKSDGIWDAIKACCILAGWDGLNGCLVPLKGAAPTNNNFVSGDYSRTAGLTADGSTKYLNTNRLVVDDPQDDCHIAAFVTASGAGNAFSIGSSDSSTTGSSYLLHKNPMTCRLRNTSNITTTLDATPSSFAGASRASSTGFTARAGNTDQAISIVSTSPTNPGTNTLQVFKYLPFSYGTATIAFYSIGESLDLALLDSRVTTLITSIGTALA